MEVIVFFDRLRRAWCMHFVRHEGEKLYVAKPIKFEWVKGEEFDFPEATLVLPGCDDKLMQSIVEQIKGAGVKPKDESKIEGEILATKYHLEDLRALLGLNKKGE